MSIISKIRKAFSYKVVRPVIYDQCLLEAYSSTSVTGGNLKGKNAVVTGATSGIGYAIAQRLLNEGCNVIITGRNVSKLEVAIGTLHHSSEVTLSYVVIDQLNPQSVEEGAKEAFKRLPIDLWVNCAGVFTKLDRTRKFREVGKDTYFEVVNTNLKSTVLASRCAIECMISRGIEGRIINISSICGFTNHYGYTPYGISKSSVIEYTKLLAEEYKGKATIVAVAPGAVATRMGDTGFGKNVSGGNSATKHVALPEEIASTVAFLASPIGKYLNGQTILASALETV